MSASSPRASCMGSIARKCRRRSPPTTDANVCQQQPRAKVRANRRGPAALSTERRPVAPRTLCPNGPRRNVVFDRRPPRAARDVGGRAGPCRLLKTAPRHRAVDWKSLVIPRAQRQRIGPTTRREIGTTNTISWADRRFFLSASSVDLHWPAPRYQSNVRDISATRRIPCQLGPRSLPPVQPTSHTCGFWTKGRRDDGEYGGRELFRP